MNKKITINFEKQKNIRKKYINDFSNNDIKINNYNCKFEIDNQTIFINNLSLFFVLLFKLHSKQQLL